MSYMGLTATQWRNRINDYNPGMYTKEFLKGKTAKELAQIQNGPSGGAKMTARAKLNATLVRNGYKFQKNKKNPAKSYHKTRAPAKNEYADLMKKLLAVLQAETRKKPRAKRQEMDSDESDEEEDSEDESDEE